MGDDHLRRSHLLVDVDQVVADLHAEWLLRYNNKYDDDLTLEDITGWDMHEFVKPEAGYRIYNFLRMPNLYRDVKPVPGSKMAVRTLRSMGFRVTFVTSCVVGSMDMKARWLQNHGFLPDNKRSLKDLVMAKDKSLVSGDVLIDDGPHNVEAYPGYTILMDYPYNRDLDHPRRAENWDQIIKYVMDLQIITGVDMPA